MEQAQESQQAASTVAREHGYPYWETEEQIRGGWVLAMQEKAEQGVTQIQHWQADQQAREGGNSNWPADMALLAEAYGKAKRPADGLQVLTAALSFTTKTGMHYYDAELYRLKGDLLLQQYLATGCQLPRTQSHTAVAAAHVDAQTCFLNAIKIAQRQHAKSFELRATVSLARLWQHQGKQKEAHQMLSEIYNWFTEGFETKDLQEAKALLKELDR